MTPTRGQIDCATRWARLALALMALSSPSARANELVPLGNLQGYTYYTDIWGYAAPDGTELALIGTGLGFSVIDVTNPSTPTEVAFFPTPATGASEIETYGEHAFLVNDQARTIQVISLVDPLHPVEVGGPIRIEGCHTACIDQEAGKLYSVRPGRDMQVLDIRDPANTVLVGSYPYRFHDLHVHAGRAYGLDPENHSLVILDVSGLPDVQLVKRVPFLVGYAHSGWLTEDGRYFIAADETVGGNLYVFELGGPEVAVEVAQFSNPFDPDAILHNIHIRGDIAYVSWYTSGVFALDVRDPTRPTLLARYDTFPGSSLGLNGNWGIYPDLPSGNILASDMSTGLWILEPRFTEADITLVLEEAGTGKPIRGASVYFPFLSESYPTDYSGRFPILLPDGTYPFQVAHPDYFPIEGELNVQWLEVSTRTFSMKLVPGGGVLAEPSPTRGATKLRFEAPAGLTEVDVFDSSGRAVRTIVSESTAPGLQEVGWDGRDLHGRLVPCGLYLFRVESGSTSRRGRVQVIR